MVGAERSSTSKGGRVAALRAAGIVSAHLIVHSIGNASSLVADMVTAFAIELPKWSGVASI